MVKVRYRLILFIINTVLLLTLMPTPQPAYAQWPPFTFSLAPSYKEGQISYQIEFGSRAEVVVTDITIKIPLPEGTRFVEANAQPGTVVEFDGSEITFFTSTLVRSRSIDASFIVEVIDPTTTVFTTPAWITWQGDQPGDYLTEDFSIDISRQTLNWEPPSSSRLQLDINATVVDSVITYNIYPKNARGGTRMWDLKINVPVPPGTVFLSAEALPPFVATFDGQEVSFFAAELARSALVAPLSFKVSTEGITNPFVTTRVWVTWKNAGPSVGRSVTVQEGTATGDIIVQPYPPHRIVFDMAGDVPLPNYDLTAIAFHETGSALEVSFRVAGELGSVGEPLEYQLYIDRDCRIDTGDVKRGGGMEYLVRYGHRNGQAAMILWEEEEGRWNWDAQIKLNSAVNDKVVTVWVPYDLLENSQQICWVAKAHNITNIFTSALPIDNFPDSRDLRVTRYEFTQPIEDITRAFAAEPSAGIFIDIGDNWQYLPGWSEPPATWKTLYFDDSDWFSGPTNIGYGNQDYATDLSLITFPVQQGGAPILAQRVDKQSGMILAILPSGDHSSVFMRRIFTTTTNSSLPTQLALEVDYEGGFIAYLNGTEVARRGLGKTGSPVSYDALATNDNTISPEVFDLSEYTTKLVTETNVLAIQAHSVDGSSLSIAPKLTWGFEPSPTQVSVTSVDETSMVGAVPSALPLAITDISGKLAVPLDNGQVAYDVYIFSLPDGQELLKIPNARQPEFWVDGQRMLINHEGGGVENVYEYNLVDGTEKVVSDAPRDSYPSYDPWGNRIVYGNSELTVGADGKRHPFIFVQCGLLPPHQEQEQWCSDIPRFGVLIPAGQMGEIWGSHPVWTATDMIAYNGCNSWAGFAACGIYIVPSSSTKGFSNGFIPTQLTRDPSDLPSDTKDNLITFSSHREGNWEVYVMDLNGADVKNLSNNRDSDDGLPTISPDGNWVAFISNRDDQWSVWIVPIVGGQARKLFDLPISHPWGDGDRTWTNERISWGP